MTRLHQPPVGLPWRRLPAGAVSSAAHRLSALWRSKRKDSFVPRAMVVTVRLTWELGRP